MGVEVTVGAAKMKLAAVCTGAGFTLAAAVAVVVVVVTVGGVKMKLATVCTGDGFKFAAATAGVAVVVGAANMKLVAVCTADGLKFAAAAAAVAVVVIGTVVVAVLARKLNTGFVDGILVGSFKPAPNPEFGGLLTDEPVPIDVGARGPVLKLTDVAVP
jgi:hypothetical protein